MNKNIHCTIYKVIDGKVAILGACGLENRYSVFEKLCTGASVAQLYSMLTCKRLNQIARIRKELAIIIKKVNIKL